MLQRILTIVFMCGISGLMAQNQIISNSVYLQKLSATSHIFLEQANEQHLFLPDADGRVSALIQMNDVSEGLQTNLKTEGRFGNIISVHLNREELISMLTDPNISYIDVSCRLNRSHPLNDTTRILSKVNEVQNGLSNGLPANYRGAGVVVGIVDIGFQPDNPTNFNDNGTAYRVRRFWQQSNKTGPKPAGFTYGSEFVQPANILLARDDDGTHGTHVTGIAGGSGHTTPQLKYRGMAPESDLVFVSIKYTNDSLAGSALGDYVVANPTILDGFRYIFDYAQSVGKPAVINLSWGMHTGPHDGNSLFDKAVENLTGPGKILVGACGNEAGNQMHVTAILNNDTAYTFAVDRSRNDYIHENFYCDFWGDSGQSFGINLSLFDTFGVKKLESPFYYSTNSGSARHFFTNGTDSMWFTLAANKKFTNNGKPEILVMAETNNARTQRVRIGITGKGRVDGWNSGQTYRWTSGSFLAKVRGNDKTGIYLDGMAQGTAGENGGTGKSTITVGAYVARNNWTDTTGKYHAQSWLKVGDLAGFSSRGPTVDGRIKPDISAPGQNIASAVNYRTFSPWMLDVTPLATRFYGNIQYWTIFSGTSMAAPHVAGIVALMLQVNPNLTPTQVKEVLYKTAIRDEFTGKDSNNQFGYGKINALEAVKMLVKLNIKDPSKKGMRCLAYPIPASDEVVFSSGLFAGREATLILMECTGRVISQSNLQFDETGLANYPTAAISDGIYSWKIVCNGNNASGRLMIRH